MSRLAGGAFTRPLVVAECGALAGHADGCSLRVDAGGRCEPVFVVVAGDVPAVVVEEQVVVSAEEDSVVDVGAAVISFPVLDVVGFGPGGWAVASGSHASAVSGGQCDALTVGEESLFAPDVDGLAVGVDGDGDGAGVAHRAFDGFDGDGVGAAFDATVPDSFTKVVFADEEADGGFPCPQQFGRVDVGTVVEQF